MMTSTRSSPSDITMPSEAAHTLSNFCRASRNTPSTILSVESGSWWNNTRLRTPASWATFTPASHDECPQPLRVVVSCSGVYRSEEHTSELQSRSDLVCRLLLEKKKKNFLIANHVDITAPPTDVAPNPLHTLLPHL